MAGSPYTITPSAAAGTGLGNYNISYQPGSLTVSPTGLTITAGGQSKTYGQALNLGTTAFTTSGLVNGDTSADEPVKFSTSATTASNVGNYTITPKLTSSTNATVT